MSPRSVCGLAFLCVALSASVAGADPGLHVAPASAPEGADAKTLKAALEKTVNADIAGDASATYLAGYTLFPKLVVMRKFVEGDTKVPTISCVVELSIVDSKGTIAAKVWGSSTSTSATPVQTLEVATHAATSRLSISLRALSERERRIERERDKTAQRK
jgi:hypothetical protein